MNTFRMHCTYLIMRGHRGRRISGVGEGDALYHADSSGINAYDIIRKMKMLYNYRCVHLC
jgi:hypothetical protein